MSSHPMTWVLLLRLQRRKTRVREVKKSAQDNMAGWEQSHSFTRSSRYPFTKLLVAHCVPGVRVGLPRLLVT